MPSLFACDKKIEQNQDDQSEASSYSLMINALQFAPSPRAMPVHRYTQLPRQSAMLLDILGMKPLRDAERARSHHEKIAARQKKERREDKQKNSMKNVSSKQQTLLTKFASNSSQVDWHQLHQDDLQAFKKMEQGLPPSLPCPIL